MDIMTFALICGAVGVAYGLMTTTWVLKQDAGNPADAGNLGGGAGRRQCLPEPAV